MSSNIVLPPPYTRMRLPAEWEKQEAVWLTWPQNRETWNPVREEVEKTYVSFISLLLQQQNVVVLCDTPAKRDEVARLCGNGAAGLDVRVCPTNDSWIRDYGALTVQASQAAGPDVLVSLDFTFNSWGGKYPPWDFDDAVPRFMAAARERQCLKVDFVLEGGSIDVNGKGLLLTTASCLLNPNRNPKCDKEKIEATLATYLGAEKVLWLESGIDGDDTDGHIDDLARFVDERTIFCAVETHKQDENYEPLRRNVDKLNRYAAALDLEVVEIPMPQRQIKAGLRTPATYLNFLMVNGAILVPTFEDARDDEVLQIFSRYLPHRRILPLDCRSLVYGQGAMHCSSMQEPRLIS